jgi:type I restriction enzyme R subunit
LTTFDEFTGNEMLSDRDIQDYHSKYIDLYNEFRKTIDEDKENINEDLVFEMELIKQIEINIDYILTLIKKYHEDNTQDKEILVDINKAIDSSIELRNKKDLINQFITSLDIQSNVDDDWHRFVEEKKIEELEAIIESEELNREATYAFVQNAFRDGAVVGIGTGISEIMAYKPSLFSPDRAYTKKRESILQKLTRFFEKFFNISGGKFNE